MTYFIFVYCCLIYSWAVSTVMTRQNAIPSERNNNNSVEPGAQDATQGNENNDEIKEDSTDTPALIPFWDLANHSDGVVTTLYNIADGQIEGATMNDIKKDEQIFIHYGNRNNANLLVHNGYDIIYRTFCI